MVNDMWLKIKLNSEYLAIGSPVSFMWNDDIAKRIRDHGKLKLELMNNQIKK